MAKIEVRCPVCSSWEKVDVSDDATKNIKKGLLAINVTAGTVCDHSFICYVDKNLTVRDSLIADFKIEAPEASEIQVTPDVEGTEIESIKFDLIKMNTTELMLAHIFRGILLGKDIVLIYYDQFLANHIINFINYVKKDLFEQKIIAMSKPDYSDNKKNYPNHLVLEKSVILKDNSRIINPKKLEVEKRIAQKFLLEDDLVTGLIILRNEIKKAHEFANNLAKLLESSATKNWTSRMLTDHISDAYHERIQISYLSFLLDIVKHYFNVKIPKIDGVSSFLGFL